MIGGSLRVVGWIVISGLLVIAAAGFALYLFVEATDDPTAGDD